MGTIYKFCLVMIAITVLSACEPNLSISNRSGTLDEDNVEEPLSGLSKKYENALNVSNAIIDKIILNDHGSIYDELFDEQ